MRGGGGVVARRAVVRWALRLLRREWRQQILVVALLTLAVGAAVFAGTAAYNLASTRDAEFGTASQRFELAVSRPDALAPYVAAAEDWFGVAEVIGHRSVSVPGSVELLEVRTQDPAGPFGAPMLDTREGRYPGAAGEVALTDRVADLFGVSMGETINVGDATSTVVGLVENPGDLDDEFALALPSTDQAPESITLLVHADEERVRGFHGTEEPGTGFTESRGQTEKTTAAVLVLVIAAVAMALVSLVAAAGFVVVAQRRLRQLAMLAAVGATERHLRAAMLANGTGVGTVAAVTGSAVAVVAWVVTAPSFEGPAGHRIDRLDVPWWFVVAAGLLSVAGASAAAWWPARAMARVPVVNALLARPPRPKRARRSALLAGVLLVYGVVALTVGVDPSEDAANPALVISGTLAAVLAVPFMAAPAIRVFAALAARLPVAGRLALRDLARYQARSGAALGAISLGLAIAVSAIVIAAAAEYGSDEGNVSDRQLMVWTGEVSDLDIFLPEPTADELADHEAAARSIARAVGADTVVSLDVAVDPTVQQPHGPQIVRSPIHHGRRVGPNTLRDSGRMYAATPELLAYLGVDAADIDADALVLTTMSKNVYLAGDFTNEEFRGNPFSDDSVERIDLHGYTSLPRSLLTEAGLDAAGLASMRIGWLVEASAPIAGDGLVAARERAAEAGLTIESRNQQGGLATIRTAASIAGVLLALAILAMTVGLIRGESARDLRTLAAVGATSRTRRALTASTAGALALLAIVLGTACAYAALIAGYWPDTERLANVPVAHLSAVAIGLPLIAALGGWLLAGREPSAIARPMME